MDKFGIDAIKDVRLAGTDDKNAVVRTVGVLDKQEIAELKDHFNKDYGAEPNVSTVSPTVGKELAKNAMIALSIASLGIIFMYRYALNGEWLYLLL